MGGQAITRGVAPTSLVIEDNDCRGGLAIFLGQTSKNGAPIDARFRVEVRATVADGEFLVGIFSTSPPHNGSPKSRAVAMASCPGAKSWSLLVYPWQQASLANGKIWASAGLPAGDAPGVTRVGERPKTYAGNGPGVVVIPAGERVMSWSAFSTGAGASVEIDQQLPAISGPPIQIPAAGGVSGGGNGGVLEGPLTFTFATVAIGGYLIETLESA